MKLNVSNRNVIVVSKRGLFREGLRRLLSDQEDIVLLGVVCTLEEARALADENVPDVIVLDQEIEREEMLKELADWLDVARLQEVVTVTMENRDMIVYNRKHVPDASVQNLLDALRGKP